MGGGDTDFSTWSSQNNLLCVDLKEHKEGEPFLESRLIVSTLYLVGIGAQLSTGNLSIKYRGELVLNAAILGSPFFASKLQASGL